MGDDRGMMGGGLVLDKMTLTCSLMMWLVSRVIWPVVMELVQSPMKMVQALHIEQVWRQRKRNELRWGVDYTVCLMMKAIPQLKVEWVEWVW